MSKHTPGPWTIRKHDSGYEVEFCEDGLRSVIAWCVDKALCDEHGEDSLLHNARLIAAAPDLLAAAELICEQLTKRFPDLTSPSSGIKVALRTAIAKARGEE